MERRLSTEAPARSHSCGGDPSVGSNIIQPNTTYTTSCSVSSGNIRNLIKTFSGLPSTETRPCSQSSYNRHNKSRIHPQWRFFFNNMNAQYLSLNLIAVKNNSNKDCKWWQNCQKITCVQWIGYWNYLEYFLLDIFCYHHYTLKITFLIFVYLNRLSLSLVRAVETGEVRCKTERTEQILTLRFPPNRKLPIVENCQLTVLISFLRFNLSWFVYLLSPPS